MERGGKGRVCVRAFALPSDLRLCICVSVPDLLERDKRPKSLQGLLLPFGCSL